MRNLHVFFSLFCMTTLVILNLVNCSSLEKKYNISTEACIPVIDLAYAVENSGESLPLSDFVEDIEYIRPEYPATLVDIIFGISFNRNYLLLEVRDRLLCYTREGKFICEISRKGQGPKEHLGIRSSDLYHNLVAIHSNYSCKILWYNADGEYIRETPVSNSVFKINILDTNRVAIHLHHGTEMDNPGLFIAGILNSNGDTVQIKKSEPYYPEGVASSPSIWKYNDTVRVLTCINDTVYAISRNEIVPRYVINFGKYKISRDAFADIRLLEQERNKCISMLSFCETATHLLVIFPYNRKRWFAVYDKQTSKISAWSSEPDNINKYGFLEGGGWLNDIDGGISPTTFFSASSDYFTVNVEPENLKTSFIENKGHIDVQYPEKQQKLEQLIHSLDEEENPVVILYKLKK